MLFTAYFMITWLTLVYPPDNLVEIYFGTFILK
jgi:hypothetical protein